MADALTPGKEGRPTGEADGRRGGVAVHVDANPGELLGQATVKTRIRVS